MSGSSEKLEIDQSHLDVDVREKNSPPIVSAMSYQDIEAELDESTMSYKLDEGSA
jgi:hypothetical protein